MSNNGREELLQRQMQPRHKKRCRRSGGRGETAQVLLMNQSKSKSVPALSASLPLSRLSNSLPEISTTSCMHAANSVAAPPVINTNKHSHHRQYPPADRNTDTGVGISLTTTRSNDLFLREEKKTDQQPASNRDYIQSNNESTSSGRISNFETEILMQPTPLCERFPPTQAPRLSLASSLLLAPTTTAASANRLNQKQPPRWKFRLLLTDDTYQCPLHRAIAFQPQQSDTATDPVTIWERLLVASPEDAVKRDGRQHETALHVLLKHRHKYYMNHHPKAMRILSIVTKMLRLHPHLVFLEDRCGNTPLHTALNYAYCHGKCDDGKNNIRSNEWAELLLLLHHLLGRNGSTPPNPIHQTPLHVHNVHGQTPMDVAIQRNHHHCCGGRPDSNSDNNTDKCIFLSDCLSSLLWEAIQENEDVIVRSC